MSDLKVEIIQAAAKLFAEKGFDKTSTREIANLSNANISLISYHFGGKEGLYVEVLRTFAKEIRDGLLQIADEFERSELTRDFFIEEIGRLVMKLIELRKKHPQFCLIFAREKIEGMPFAKDIHNETFFPLLERFVRIFKIAQEKGFVRKDVFPPLFFLFLSEGTFGFFEMTTCGLPTPNHFDVFLENPEKLRDQILSFFLRGVLL